MSTETTDRPEPARHCANCGAVPTGPFCSSCGQSTKDIRRPALSLIADYVDGIASWDGRLLRTLRHLYTRPGAVAADYVAGRRASVTAPVRLYLIMAIAFFAVFALAQIRVFGVIFEPTEAEIRSQTAEQAAARIEAWERLDRIVREGGIEEGLACGVMPGPEEIDSSGSLVYSRGTNFQIYFFTEGETPSGRILRPEDEACIRRLFSQIGVDFGWYTPVFAQMIRNPAVFENRLTAIAGQAFVAMVLAFALLNLAVHPRRRLIEHIVYSFYWHAAAIPAIALAAGIRLTTGGTVETALFWLMAAGMIGFSLLQERRFYRASLLGLALRLPVLLTGYLLALVAGIIGLLWLGAL